MGNKIKTLILRFTTWAQANWLALIISMAVMMMFFLCLVMFSWIFGYWANALFAFKFELGSCWQGVSAVVTGIVGIVGVAKAAWTKYATDSQYNSEQGKYPYLDIGGNKHE